MNFGDDDSPFGLEASGESESLSEPEDEESVSTVDR